MANIDSETAGQLTDADHVRSMTESDGWRISVAKLHARILDLQNISNLDVKLPLEPQILGRKLAAEEMYAWLKHDVFGFVEQQENSRNQLVEKKLDDFIGRPTP